MSWGGAGARKRKYHHDGGNHHDVEFDWVNGQACLEGTYVCVKLFGLVTNKFQNGMFRGIDAPRLSL